MKKYFLPIAAAVAIFAASGLILKYYGKNYSYETGTAKNSPIAAFSPAASPASDKSSEQKSVVIILSPHFDDAVLSLGGFLSGNQSETRVDTFFSGKPSQDLHTKWDRISGFRDSNEALPLRALENKKALGELGAEIKNYDYPDFQYRPKGRDGSVEKSMEKDIGSIISKYPAAKISIYGPADFGTKITHPDHEILHQALIGAAKGNTNPDIHFLMYEDFPYVRQFNKSNLGSLIGHLEAKDGVKLEEKDIEIDEMGLFKKIKALKDYTSQIAAFSSQGSDIASLAESFSRARCKAAHSEWYACEAVYQITF